METPLDTSFTTNATPLAAGGAVSSTPRPQPYAIRQRTCDRCRWAYDEDAFFNLYGSKDSRILESRRRTTCAGCEQTLGDAKKNEQRSITKAANAISSHAKRHNMPRSEFAHRYDWDLKRMAYDIDHAYENTCVYCWQPYASMDGGLSVVTIDIIDPTAEPYYRTNTKWCCRTCNTQKQRMTPALWARRCAAWAQWRENQHRIPDALSLF